ncbi:hypothetical protein [Chryseobacterium arthrosphaerae]|uniref:Uncharacterized protein n=1 Tax=Chryseobacterium arthrosphaerae TaxID=651561 RepID=A0A1B8ZQP7_9FLAO|nr:hypothetical protein [Chryseobacterium arthrosphaerae]OCA73921.1 hypothetical protein BBI00_06020 [Chryseobacterium arthrosphaerae]
MERNRILKNAVIFFLLWMAENVAISCKDNKSAAPTSSVNHHGQKGSGTSQHTVETKAELVGNY